MLAKSAVPARNWPEEVRSPAARRDWTPTILLAPVVIYMTVVGFYPLVHSLYISFTDYNPVQGQNGAWIGLDNYADGFH